jgi:hypothetical protein
LAGGLDYKIKILHHHHHTTTMPRREKRKSITDASRIVTTPLAGANATASPAAAFPVAAAAVANVPPPPTQCEQTSRMEQVVLDVRDKNRPEQSADIYDAKTKEFLQFANHVYPHDPYKNSLSAEKVYRFMFYQTFRGQKKRGGKKRLSVIYFDAEGYDSVMDEFEVWWKEGRIGEAPKPDKPCGKQCFDQYKAVLRKIYKRQVACGVCGIPWEHIWTLRCDELNSLVKERKAIAKKTNYEEKMQAEFAPYAAVDRYDEIEDVLWSRGQYTTRSAGAWLRHRYICLHTTSGILRSESVHRAELSDFLPLQIQKPDDPHPLFLMITQLAFGKYISYCVCVLCFVVIVSCTFYCVYVLLI